MFFSTLNEDTCSLLSSHQFQRWGDICSTHALLSYIHIMFIFGLKHIINVCFMTLVCSLHLWPRRDPSFAHLVLVNLWSPVDSHYGHRITVLDCDWLTVWKYLAVTIRLLEDIVCVYILCICVCQRSARLSHSHLFPQVKRAGCHKRKRKM